MLAEDPKGINVPCIFPLIQFKTGHQQDTRGACSTDLDGNNTKFIESRSGRRGVGMDGTSPSQSSRSTPLPHKIIDESACFVLPGGR